MRRSAAVLAVVAVAACGGPKPDVSPTSPPPTKQAFRPSELDRNAIARLRAIEVRHLVASREQRREARHLARIAEEAAARRAAEIAASQVTSTLSGDFARLRGCEAPDDGYAENTGNGYYGAYQFDLSTWRSTLDRLGIDFAGLPSEASAALQDRAARALQDDRGWSPWPACAAKLGLTPR